MIGYVYGPGNIKLTANQELGLKVATPVGTLVGQLLFGWLADRVGRKRMCTSVFPFLLSGNLIAGTDGVELMIIIVATFGQAVAGSGHAVNFLGVMIVWRFIVCSPHIYVFFQFLIVNVRWVWALEEIIHYQQSFHPSSQVHTFVVV